MKWVLALLCSLCLGSVASAENQIGYLLGPQGNPLTLLFTYPTNVSEHRTVLNIAGGHGGEDIQLQSDDYNYIVRYRVNGTVYQHLFSLTSLSPPNVLITSITCTVDFEDGPNGYFEYQPMPGTTDSSHPQFEVTASGTTLVSIVTGNKIDDVDVGNCAIAVCHLNKGQDWYNGGGTGTHILHSGEGFDYVVAGAATNDVLWTGPAVVPGQLWDLDAGFETVNHGTEVDYFPMNQW